MPLHGKSEWVVGEFDGFDEPVWCMARNTKGGRDVFESLMVVAVHFDDRLAQYVRDARASSIFTSCTSTVRKLPG
jgi:hypothetical protein